MADNSESGPDIWYINQVKCIKDRESHKNDILKTLSSISVLIFLMLAKE